MRVWLRRSAWRLFVAVSGAVLFLEGCDPQTRAAVEEGIITSSSSLIGAVLRALIELSQEARQEETARLLMDAAGRVFA